MARMSRLGVEVLFERSKVEVSFGPASVYMQRLLHVECEKGARAIEIAAFRRQHSLPRDVFDQSQCSRRALTNPIAMETPCGSLSGSTLSNSDTS